MCVMYSTIQYSAYKRELGNHADPIDLNCPVCSIPYDPKSHMVAHSGNGVLRHAMHWECLENWIREKWNASPSQPINCILCDRKIQNVEEFLSGWRAKALKMISNMPLMITGALTAGAGLFAGTVVTHFTVNPCFSFLATMGVITKTAEFIGYERMVSKSVLTGMILASGIWNAIYGVRVSTVPAFMALGMGISFGIEIARGR